MWDFYASLPAPVAVGIEATGSMGWFLRLMEELGGGTHLHHADGCQKVTTLVHAPSTRGRYRNGSFPPS